MVGLLLVNPKISDPDPIYKEKKKLNLDYANPESSIYKGFKTPPDVIILKSRPILWIQSIV